MAKFDYGRMQKTATRLLDRFNQGRVEFLRENATPGAEPWEAGEPWRELFSLPATVRRVEQEYIDGTLIVGTEDQVTFAVPPFEPMLTDQIVVDGSLRTLIDVRRIPAAGIAVAYVAFVAGSGSQFEFPFTSKDGSLLLTNMFGDVGLTSKSGSFA